MKKTLFSIILTAIATLAMAQNATLPQNITLKALDGSSVQTSALQNDGKPMIVSFWATWCKPCNRELNTIKEVYEEWQEETGVKLIAISIDENQDFKRAMNVVNVPHTFVINGKGEIVWQHTTFVEGDEEELLEAVKKAIE